MTRLYFAAAAANAWVLIAILLGAFVAQFANAEPPCPLCVMQRIGMMLAALGPCHILIAGQRGRLEARDIGLGCGMLVLGSLVGGAVAMRQVMLHILPGDPGFGAPILGYHLYTWAFIAFVCNLAAAGVQLVGLAWHRPEAAAAAGSLLVRLTVGTLAAVIIANILSVIAEAGFAWHLPDNPVGYRLFGG
jgi:disulfide bond formation protein DsbB